MTLLLLPAELNVRREGSEVVPVNMVKIVVAAAKSGGKQFAVLARRDAANTVAGIAESLGLERPTGALLADLDPKGRGGSRPQAGRR